MLIALCRKGLLALGSVYGHLLGVFSPSDRRARETAARAAIGKILLIVIAAKIVAKQADCILPFRTTGNCC